MKQFLIFCIIVLVGSQAGAQNFKVTLQTSQYKSGLAYLTYHMGKNLNIEDSAIVTSNGTAIFTAKRKLLPGVYAVVLPGKRISVDFFVDKEQQISIKIDTTDLIGKTVVTGSKENILFQQYQQYISVKGKLLEAEREGYMKSTTKKDSALHEANYLKFNKELNDYREGIIRDNGKSMMAVLMNAMKEPQGLNKKMITRNDSLENYYYYKAHYWDGITLMDDRIIRTPFFFFQSSKNIIEKCCHHRQIALSKK